MSIDVDDVGALCIAHALADAGEANLIAVTQDTANAHGIGAIMAINRYYGRSTPVGSYSGRVGDKEHTPSYWDDWTLQGQGWYTEGLAATSPVPAEATADSVRILRAALAAASADSKVTIAAIGHATNLYGLLHSEPDGLSPMNGVDLVAAKVKELVWMGGSFTDNHRVEWNFGAYGGDPFGFAGAYAELGPLTNGTLSAWPSSVPIIFISYESGSRVRSGGVLKQGAPVASPCRKAYMDFCGADGSGGGLPTWCEPQGRNAWDLMAVMLAVRGPGKYYQLVPGRNWVDPETGRNVWQNATTDGRSVLVEDVSTLSTFGASFSQFQAYAAPGKFSVIGSEIDQLLLRNPLATSPSVPPSTPPPAPTTKPPPPPFSTSSPPPPLPYPTSPFASPSPPLPRAPPTALRAAANSTSRQPENRTISSWLLPRSHEALSGFPPSPLLIPPPSHQSAPERSQTRLLIVFLFAAVIATMFTAYSRPCSLESVEPAMIEMKEASRQLANKLRANLPERCRHFKKTLMKIDLKKMFMKVDFKKTFMKVEKVDWPEDETCARACVTSDEWSPEPPRRLELD